MDCDLQHDTDYIFKMWSKFRKKKVDIVVAIRFAKTSFYGNLGFLRSIISKFGSFFINF
mgnify:CR=1 FL=1